MKHSILNKEKYLTKQQSHIVGSNEYPMYLRAGAGTGKTEVLVQKILHILRMDQSVSLSNFAIITFTNKATEEMQGRISDALFREWLDKGSNSNGDSLNVDTVNMVDISTIHSFCERLIHRFGLQINVAPNFKVKSFRKETSAIVSSVVNEYCDNPLLADIPAYSMEKLVMVFLANNTNRGIRFDEQLSQKLLQFEAGNQYWDAFRKLFLEIYMRVETEIENEKRRCNIVTPNDLIRLTADLLSVSSVVKRVAEKYRYVFVDEFQDTNRDQFNLVDCLIKQGVKVFLVGDDKQSIYAFRGADVQNSQEMHALIKKENNKGGREYLSENFRSTKEVIKTINDIFSQKFTYNGEKLLFPVEPLQIPSTSASEPGISPIVFTYEKTVRDILQDVLQNTTLEGRPAQYGDIAVLCRRNFDLDRIASELKAEGVPVCVVGGKGFYRTKEVIDTYKLLNASVIGSESALNEVRFTDYFKAYEESDFDRLIIDLQEQLRVETVDSAIAHLYERSRIIEYYRSKKDFQAVSNLLKLKEMAQTLMDREHMQPLQFVEYLYIMISTNQEEDEASVPEVERDNGVVRLYSIHKAKGLSFPIVVIPNCDNKLNRPITKPKIILDLKAEQPTIAFNSEVVSPDLSQDDVYNNLLEANIREQLEEEIRVFYVACTRAEKQIVIANTKSKEDVLQTLWYRDYASVSRWLLEMKREW